MTTVVRTTGRYKSSSEEPTPSDSPVTPRELEPLRRSSGYERFAANLFFLFFVAPILSPSIYGVTIYLEVIVALLTPTYWRWLACQSFRPPVVVSMLVLSVSLLLTRPEGVIELASIVVTVTYLVFCYERSVLFLLRYVCVSVAFAAAQYLLLRIDPVLAFQIGPESIAKAVWGPYATETNSNFFAFFSGFERVSGLSREAGFFAALLTSSAVVYALAFRRVPVGALGVLLVGFLVSLSKISLLAPIVFAIVRTRRLLDAVPWPAAVLSLYAGIYLMSRHFEAFILDPPNASFMHRFGANLFLSELSVKDFLFGTDLAEVRDSVAIRLSFQYDQAAGMSGFIVNYGAVTGVLAFVVFVALRARTGALLLICVGTLNVDFLTSQNFVTLIYFAAFYLLPRSGAEARSQTRFNPQSNELQGPRHVSAST